MGNIMYVYKEKDIAAEDLYQKRRLVSLINDMGYFGGGTPTYEVDHKHLQCLTDVQLMMEAHSQEYRKVIFGKF